MRTTQQEQQQEQQLGGMATVSSSFSFDGSNNSSNNMTTTTHGSSGSSFDSNSPENGPLLLTKKVDGGSGGGAKLNTEMTAAISKRSQQSKRKHNKKNGQTQKQKPKQSVEDETIIGESSILSNLLNENPEFHYCSARSNSTRRDQSRNIGGRKRGRNDGKGQLPNFDWDDTSLSSFRPIFGPQNRYRIKILTKCCWIVIRRFRPHRDIPYSFRKLQNYLLFRRPQQQPNNQTLHHQALRFLLVVVSLIFLGCLAIASGAAFTAVCAWRFGSVVCFFLPSLFVDWNEVASVCPWWLLNFFHNLRWFLMQIDRVILFGNRWRGREWNKNGFDFTDSINNTDVRSKPQSSARDQYLWKLPPPEVLTRSSKLIPIETVTPRNSTMVSSEPFNNNSNCQNRAGVEHHWGKFTTQHIEAIDYCYIMLREEFIQKQYTKLKRRRSSKKETMENIGEDKRVQEPMKNLSYRASNISTIEDFRQEFDEIDEVTGLSSRLQEIFQSEDSFDDCDSNAVADTQHKTSDNIKAVCYDEVETIGSGSDGTTIDMNWMDVGTKIGMKLLGSSAVQKAMASHDTVDKISSLKDKMDSHFKKDNSNKATQGSISQPSTPFFDADGEISEFEVSSPRVSGERTAASIQNKNQAAAGYQLDPYAQALPVHTMWTSAEAALSPNHSFATILTSGTKEDSTLGSPGVVSVSPLKCSSAQNSLVSSPVIPERNGNDFIVTNDIGLPTIDFVAVSSTARNDNPKKTSELVEQSPQLPQIPATLTKKNVRRRKRKTNPTKDASIELVCNGDDGRKHFIQQLAPPSSKSRRPMLPPGVKIAVPLFPITPDDPKRSSSSRKRRKERFQMATVVSSKRICVFEKNNMPQSGNRGTNCLTISVNLDKCFLRNGQFATMTIRIMDEWGPKYMPKHSKLPIGCCVSTSFGLGVLVGWRVEDDCHIVRSLWQRRGSGSACAYLRRDSIHATMEAAVGFEVNTTRGHGTVVGYVNGGPDFKCGCYLVSIPEEGSDKKLLLELVRANVFSCLSAKFIPIVEHIRAAAQYQLQIDRYEELQDPSSTDEDHTTKMLGEFSKHFDILWRSFLRAIEEDHEFDDGMNEFIQRCIHFLNQLDAPGTGGTPLSKDNNGVDIDGFDASIVIHDDMDSNSQHSRSADSFISPKGGDKPDSGFWLMDNMFDIFNSKRDVDRGEGDNPAAEGIEIQCTPRHHRRSEKNYARAFAVLRTLTRTVTNAKAASADEPSFKIALTICHELLLFIKTVIIVQRKNMNHDSLETWRLSWSEIVSVFGPVQRRMRRIGEGIAGMLF